MKLHYCIWLRFLFIQPACLRHLWLLLTIGIGSLLFTSVPVFGTIYITVTGANVKRAKIAVGRIHLLPKGTADTALSKKLREELRADLEFTNLFDFIEDSQVARLDSADELYNARYDEFSAIGASFLLNLGYRMDRNILVVEALLFDIVGKKKILGTRYQHEASKYYRVAHTIAEDVLKELTGERGLFLSRILMVCRDPKKRSPSKEVFVVDSDGRNLVQLTRDSTLSLSPTWAPDGRSIAYTQFELRRYGKIREKGTVIKRHNLLTGERKVVVGKRGANSGAAWSPDGSRIAATLSFTGIPEIYLLNPDGRGEPEPFSRMIQWKRISGDGYQLADPKQLLDVEPNWSPNGTKLVLSSARSGHPMIYVVDIIAKTATQLTFAGTYNASPAWSPKGDKIVFAAQRLAEGNFDLYLIDPDGNNLELSYGQEVGLTVDRSRGIASES